MNTNPEYQKVFDACVEILHREDEAHRIAAFIWERRGSTILIVDEILIVEALIERHKPAILRFILKCVKGNADRAKDVFQEVSVKIFTRLRTFKGRSSFLGWVFSIARNEALMLHRQYRHLDQFDSENFTHAMSCNSNVGAKQTFDRIMIDQILSCIQPGDRILFLMFYRDGFSSREISKLLDIKPASFRVRIFRMTKTIQAYLKEADDA